MYLSLPSLAKCLTYDSILCAFNGARAALLCTR